MASYRNPVSVVSWRRRMFVTARVAAWVSFGCWMLLLAMELWR